MALTRDDVRWAYRVMLDREPDNKGHIDYVIGSLPDMKSLRSVLFQSEEFLEHNRSILKRLPVTIPPSKATYTIGNKPIVDITALNELAVSQGIYEKAEIAFIVKCLREGDTVLDIGGGRGIHSVVAASCVGETGRVYTIEADPRCIALIKKNASENEVERRIEIVRATVTGLSDDSGYASLGAETNASPPHHGQVIHDTLDNLIGRSGRVKLLRIDQDGAEILALKGATQILKQDRPLILSKVEPNRIEQRSNSNWQQYFGLLADYGYKPHILDEDGLGKTHPLLESGRTYSVVFSTTEHYIG